MMGEALEATIEAMAAVVLYERRCRRGERECGKLRGWNWPDFIKGCGGGRGRRRGGERTTIDKPCAVRKAGFWINDVKKVQTKREYVSISRACLK